MVSVEDTSWDDCQLITILPMRIMQLAPLSEMIHPRGDTPAKVGQLMDYSSGHVKHEQREQGTEAVGAELQVDRALAYPEVTCLRTPKVL